MNNDSTARLCPCGCGTERKLYNGQRSVVCHAFWKTLPLALRTAFNHAHKGIERRVATRRIMELAKAHNQRREVPA